MRPLLAITGSRRDLGALYINVNGNWVYGDLVSVQSGDRLLHRGELP